MSRARRNRSGALKVGSLLLLLGLLGTTISRLEIGRQRRLAELARVRIVWADALHRQRVEFERTSAAENFAANEETKARRSIEMQWMQAKEEVVALERRALDRRAAMRAEIARRKAEDASALSGNNRDPERGFAKLEYFQNLGRATPRAALQTLVWAALKGDNESLAGGLAVSPSREQAVMLARTRSERKTLPATPEELELAVLWFSSSVVEIPAMHISGEVVENPSHVTLIVRGWTGRDQKLPMTLGSDGWQVVVPWSAIETVRKKIAGASTPLPRN